MDKCIMSKKEREQLIVFKKLEAREITQTVAAQLLGMTQRGVRKKFKRYKKEGEAGIIHKSRGAPSPKRWKEIERTVALSLLTSDLYKDFGPTFAVEQLAQQGIRVSKETVRKLMIEQGLWLHKKRRITFRKQRERRALFGMMIQLDGSNHDWFEGRGSKCTLLVFIDDATSKIVWLEFVESESFKAIATATKKYLELYGRPAAFYVDRASVFKINQNNEEKDKDTQFHKSMKELAIELIHARSPQAKGRVERANKTLQDRLVKNLRLHSISSLEDANRFVQKGTFMHEHNAKYAVPPACQGDAHRSLIEHSVDALFCTQETRVVTNDFTVAYNRKTLQLERSKAYLKPKDRVSIKEYLDGTLSIHAKNHSLPFKEIPMRKPKPVEFVSWENKVSDQPQQS